MARVESALSMSSLAVGQKEVRSKWQLSVRDDE